MANYIFRLENFSISDTRSFHEDTDIVGFAVRVGDQLIGPITKTTGDVNNGTHTLNMDLGPVEITALNRVIVGWQIWNNGHNGHPNGDELVAALQSDIPALPDLTLEELVSGDADPSAGDPDPGADMNDASGQDDSLGSIAEKILVHLVTLGIDILIANCDGLVAKQKVNTTGEDIIAQVKMNGGQWISQPIPFIGSSSPSGCNSSRSNYRVTWSVRRADASLVLDHVGGGAGGGGGVGGHGGAGGHHLD